MDIFDTRPNLNAMAEAQAHELAAAKKELAAVTADVTRADYVTRRAVERAEKAEATIAELRGLLADAAIDAARERKP